MRSLGLSLALLLAVLFAPAALPAQQLATNRVTIKVTDLTGAAVQHAQIQVAPSPDSAPANMETDDKGQLSLDLKPGGYALFVETSGFSNFATHIEVLKTSLEGQVFPVVLQLAPTGSPMVSPASSKDDLLLLMYPYHEAVSLKPPDLKALPHRTATVHNAESNADEVYSGVSLAALLGNFGGPVGKELHGRAFSNYLIASGSDGDRAIFTLAEVDPSFHAGEVLVADRMNGRPLDAQSGPFKLVVTEDKRPDRSVRKLNYIELKSVD